MATAKKNGFGLIGKKVHWNYRGVIAHGTVRSIAKQGTTRDTTEYNVSETSHTTKSGKKLPSKDGKLNTMRKHYGSALKVG